MKIINLARDWDGASYSPDKQTSLYPLDESAIALCGCGSRTIVASSITNNSGADLYFQVREATVDGPLVHSHHLPNGFTTPFNLPITTGAAPFVTISTTPIDYTPPASVDGVGMTLWTR